GGRGGPVVPPGIPAGGGAPPPRAPPPAPTRRGAPRGPGGAPPGPPPPPRAPPGRPAPAPPPAPPPPPSPPGRGAPPPAPGGRAPLGLRQPFAGQPGPGVVRAEAFLPVPGDRGEAPHGVGRLPVLQRVQREVVAGVHRLGVVRSVQPLLGLHHRGELALRGLPV